MNWTDEDEGAEREFENYMLEAGKVGTIIVEEFEPLPKPDPPEYTEIDLLDWEALPKARDTIVLTWLHHEEEPGQLGLHLQVRLGFGFEFLRV